MSSRLSGGPTANVTLAMLDQWQFAEAASRGFQGQGRVGLPESAALSIQRYLKLKSTFID